MSIRYWSSDVCSSDLFRSIIRQSLDFENNINIVLVDDGSSDQSDRIIKKWVEKYPDNIIYLRKNNGGQASARNMGLEFVESNLIDVDFVTFIDSDDFVDLTYFSSVDTMLGRNRKNLVHMVGCSQIFYDDDTGGIRDRHQLRYRFLKGDVT